MIGRHDPFLNQVADAAMTRKTSPTSSRALRYLPHGFGPSDGDAVDDLRMRHRQAAAEQGVVVRGVIRFHAANLIVEYQPRTRL